MAQFEPAPTYADVILLDPQGKLPPKFNPIWLGWFLRVAEVLASAGGTGGGINHNDLTGLQGGAGTEFYHLSAAQAAQVVALGPSALFTPSTSANVNLASVSMTQIKFVKAGGMVVMSGRFTATASGAGTAGFQFSLPVSFNFTAVEDLAGAAAELSLGAELLANVANDTAQVRWTAPDALAHAFSWIAQYRIN